MAGGAELAEFVAVGVGLAFGVFGAGAQVRAQLITLTGRLGRIASVVHIGPCWNAYIWLREECCTQT